MTLEELRRISEEVGERKGWDFSQMRTDRDEDHLDALNTLLTNFRTPRGILTNEHRELFIAQKEDVEAFGEDVIDVPFDRPRADGMRLGDLPVAHAGTDASHHLQLARAQPRSIMPRWL